MQVGGKEVGRAGEGGATIKSGGNVPRGRRLEAKKSSLEKETRPVTVAFCQTRQNISQSGRTNLNLGFPSVARRRRARSGTKNTLTKERTTTHPGECVDAK